MKSGFLDDVPQTIRSFYEEETIQERKSDYLDNPTAIGSGYSAPRFGYPNGSYLATKPSPVLTPSLESGRPQSDFIDKLIEPEGSNGGSGSPRPYPYNDTPSGGTGTPPNPTMDSSGSTGTNTGFKTVGISVTNIEPVAPGNPADNDGIETVSTIQPQNPIAKVYDSLKAGGSWVPMALLGSAVLGTLYMSRKKKG